MNTKITALLLSLGAAAFFACSSSNDNGAIGDADAGTSVPANDAGAPGDDASYADVAPANDTAVDAPVVDTTPKKIVAATSGSVTGVTTDGYVVYRTDTGLNVVALTPGATPTPITSASATVTIKGKVVFVWTNVDYTSGLGDLTIWTAAGGVKTVGSTLFTEDSVAVSADGSVFVYATNVTATTEDVVAASTGNPAAHETILSAAGRGSISTCRASYTFAGARIVTASCADGSLSATLRTFAATGTMTQSASLDGGADADAGSVWNATTVASDAQPTFSCDSAGNKIFFVSTSSQGKVYDVVGGNVTPVDNGVTWATFTPDGANLLYTVGDQLRRTPLASVNPIPIVTVGFVQRAGWSNDLGWVLYSKTVTYEGTEKRDLYLASTASLNSNPAALITGANGNVTRSPFTRDGAYALWLTDLTATGSTLHARATAGGTDRTFAAVDGAVAATASKIVFADAHSDPNVYPVTADLKFVDLAKPDAPTTLNTKIIDGRTYQLTAAGDAVVYAKADGIYLQMLP